MLGPSNLAPDPPAIEYWPTDELLIVDGLPQAIQRHPLLMAYVRQAGGEGAGSNRIQLPTSPDELADRYQTVQRLLERLGVSAIPSEHVSGALKRVVENEQMFAEFSRRAEEIWHSEIEPQEFAEFVQTIQRACPGRTFYRKQLLSAYHLAFSQNACNFSVPGAGKTSVVYAAFAFLNSLPIEDPRRVDALLIVGPLSSFKAWEDEYVQIFDRSARSKRISGGVPASERRDILRGIDYDYRDLELVLTSYQTVANAEADFRAFLRNTHRPTMMVLDEAHNVKRDDGYWANAVLRLAPEACSRVVLTGTPAPNGYEDLHNLFRFIYPDRQLLGFPLPTLRAMSDGQMPRAVPALKENIRPFYTRIRKSDLGLPPVAERRVRIPMSETQETIYRSLERRILPQLSAQLSTASAQSILRVKAPLIRLRQAAVNPQLLLRPIQEEQLFSTDQSFDFNIAELEIANAISRLDPLADLPRLSVCKNLVTQVLADQGKVLIWSYFLGNLDLLSRELAEFAPYMAVLTGATPLANDADEEDEQALRTREQIIDSFHNTKAPFILIANPQAVGESISLHKACRTAIYFDRDFNCGRYVQSKDRIHRYNPISADEVTYYLLMSEATVDEQIDARLALKERRMQDLVDSEDIPLFSGDFGENSEDIRAILDAYEHRIAI